MNTSLKERYTFPGQTKIQLFIRYFGLIILPTGHKQQKKKKIHKKKEKKRKEKQPSDDCCQCPQKQNIT